MRSSSPVPIISGAPGFPLRPLYLPAVQHCQGLHQLLPFGRRQPRQRRLRLRVKEGDYLQAGDTLMVFED